MSQEIDNSNLEIENSFNSGNETGKTIQAKPTNCIKLMIEKGLITEKEAKNRFFIVDDPYSIILINNLPKNLKK